MFQKKTVPIASIKSEERPQLETVMRKGQAGKHLHKTPTLADELENKVGIFRVSSTVGKNYVEFFFLGFIFYMNFK